MVATSPNLRDGPVPGVVVFLRRPGARGVIWAVEDMARLVVVGWIVGMIVKAWVDRVMIDAMVSIRVMLDGMMY